MLPLLLVSLLSACRPDDALAVVSPAQPDATGEDGTDGPYGVALTERRYAARVAGKVDVDVLLPVDEAGGLAVADAPTVVLVQGGLVPVERYHWLAAHLATRGYAVLAPHHPLDLAIFAIGNAQASLEGALGDDTLAGWVSPQAAVAGHSLGGVVSVKNWLADDTFAAVALLASFPAGGDDPAERAGSPVLSITGAVDGSALPEDVEAGFERFSDPRWLAIVDDLNHYGWTDGVTAEELAGDGDVVDLPGARQHALAVIDTFLDATLRGDPDAAAALDAPAFVGVAVSR